MAGNGNGLPDITGNAGQKEGTKATQHDYGKDSHRPTRDLFACSFK